MVVVNTTNFRLLHSESYGSAIRNRNTGSLGLSLNDDKCILGIKTKMEVDLYFTVVFNHGILIFDKTPQINFLKRVLIRYEEKR